MTHWKKRRIETLEGDLNGGDTGNQTKHVQENKQQAKQRRDEKRTRGETCTSAHLCLAQSSVDV